MTCPSKGPCPWWARVGFRGSILLLIAAFDVVYGWSRMIHPDPEYKMGEQYRLLAQFFPVHSPTQAMTIWGMLWWFVAAICAVSAFRRDDRWGFGAALALKVTWLVGNAYAWANGLPGGGGLLAVWVLILLVVARISAWPEPVRELEDLAEEIRNTGEIPRITDGDEHGA